eukprot:gene21068-25040_t
MKRTILTLLMIPLISMKISAQERLQVNVHPGIELFTIIQLLSDQLPDPNPSSYSKEVMDYFKKYRKHPAVLKVKSFDKVYPDLTELGWTMTNFPAIKIYEPTENINWYKYYGKKNVLEYLKLARDFAQKSNFWAFYSAHQDNYKKWAEDIRKGVLESGTMEQLQQFYGFNSEVKWYICIDPLNSWGSHAITTKNLNPQFSQLVAYNTGYFNKKSTVQLDPVFEYQGFDYLVWHEGSHIFLEPFFIKYKKEIDQLSYLFNKDDPGMKQNGIGNWEYCLNENMVRAVVSYLYASFRTERSAKRLIARETASDFIYVEELSPFIRENYGKGKKYEQFATLFPAMLQMLKEKHPQTI